MKKLLFGSMLLMLVAAYASKDNNSGATFAKANWNNIKDTVPKDTSDTTHKPDSQMLADLLAKR